MNKTVTILRATSHSGKTTFADYISSLAQGTVVCCADDYFTDEKGNYNFDPKKLGFVHKQCFQKFENAIGQGVENIIIANTNTSESEFNKYAELAKSEGYRVFFIILERRHESKNNHNVPEEVLENQERKILNSLKLR